MMISGIILALSCCLSVTTVSMTSTQKDFIDSNYDALQIIEENGLKNSYEIENHIIDYIDNNNSNKTRNSNPESSTEMVEGEQKKHLDDNYSNYSWYKKDDILTRKASGNIPLEMYDTEYSYDVLKEGLDKTNSSSSYGGCGSIAMIGILDYFGRYLNFDTIIQNPNLRDNRVFLAEEVFSETNSYELPGGNTLITPWDYKSSCNNFFSRHGLGDKIKCNYNGTLLTGNKKTELLEIIKNHINEGLPVTMYTGLLSGDGAFGKHYTNIYGYEEWIGIDDAGNRFTKYLLEARINGNKQNFYYCDDSILDTGMMGIIYYDLNYKNTQNIYASDFANYFVNDAGQGQYFFEEKSKRITTANNFSFNTTRLRCSYIENQYLVLSANRQGVKDAFLEMYMPAYVQRLQFDMSLWSGIEGMWYGNCKVSIQIYQDNTWKDYIIYDTLEMSKLKSSPDTHVVMLPQDTIKVRFYAIHNSPSGDRNKGRVVLDNVQFKYF